MPLAPSGLSGDGVSVECTSKLGRSAADAIDVVGEVGGQRVAVVVEADLLEQRLADAGGHAAVLLALDEQRVEHGAAVVHGDVAAAAATRPVSRSTSTTAMWAPNGNVASPWSKRARRPASRRRPSPRGPPGQLAPVEGGRRDAGHPDRAGVDVDHDVGDVGLEQASRQLLGLLDERLGGPVHGRPAELQRPRTRPCRRRVGTRSVSPSTSRIRSTGMPVWSWTSMANAVWWPWPWENVPARTVAEPSSWTSTAPNSLVAAAGGDLDVGADTDAERRCRSPRSRRSACSRRSCVVADRPRRRPRAAVA